LPLRFGPRHGWEHLDGLRDAETGLDYFEARYFSAAQGRFTGADLVFADQHPGDPQSWNMYAYVRSNPLRYTDPDGHCEKDGETHGFWWCAGHVFGITQTGKEAHDEAESERQWLVSNIARNSDQTNYLSSASDAAVRKLYGQWDSALQKAQCDAGSCDTYYQAKAFRRAANGGLVLYRGGRFDNVNPKEYRTDAGGNVRSGEGARGPSLFDTPAKIPPRFQGDINEVTLIPPELTTIPWGQPGHYEVVPAAPGMHPGVFLELLKTIGLKALDGLRGPILIE